MLCWQLAEIYKKNHFNFILFLVTKKFKSVFISCNVYFISSDDIFIVF